MHNFVRKTIDDIIQFRLIFFFHYYMCNIRTLQCYARGRQKNFFLSQLYTMATMRVGMTYNRRYTYIYDSSGKIE